MPQQPKPPGDRPLVSQYADDPEMAELVGLFVHELPDRLRAFAAAWSEKRVEDLRRMAHQLKGAAPGYGFPAIGQAAGSLESRLKTLPPEDGAAALESLAEEFRRLVELCTRASEGGR